MSDVMDEKTQRKFDKQIAKFQKFVNANPDVREYTFKTDDQKVIDAIGVWVYDNEINGYPINGGAVVSW